MKYLSVCSGIEAATVAWHGFGWTPVAFAEVEAFPSAVLAHHYPTVPNLGDLTRYREWPEELLVEVDLLVGGTPCQAFSVAGLRRSLDDERGNLSLTYVNLFHHINEVRKRHGRSPAVALWENVPGVLSTKDNAFGCFIGGLLGCDEAPETESGKWDKAGFLSSETVRVGYRVLDAQYFGVAQRRRRVFLAAVPCELVERFGERACPSEILSLRESVLGNPPTRGAAWEGAARAAQGGPASRGGCGEPFYLDRASFNQGENALYEPQITSDGVAGAAVAVPPVCGTLSDGAHMGGGLTARTPTTAESCPSVANSLTARMHKGFNTTVDEGQTPIVTHGGVFDGAVAFKPSHFTRGKDGAPASNTPPLSADADKWDQDIVVFTKAKRAQSNTDDETWVPGSVAPTQNQFDSGDTRATTVVAYNIHTSLATNGATETEWHTALRSRTPGQSENSTTTVVAFTQNSRDEVRLINDDGNLAGALNAEGGMHQTNYLAFSPLQGGRSMPVTPGSPTFEAGTGNKTPAVVFANRTRDGIKVPEVMKDGVVPALTNPGGGGRSDAVNVASAMQVRRLTPTECAYLQGFPADYLDITFRKKPAADGPKYRALGNSMAVPCMWWLGLRIHKATSHD